jgi:hypothetical protein
MSEVLQENPAHIARYEELRKHVTERQSLVGRFGLAVLLQQGLAVWVAQWSKMPEPTPARSAESSSPAPLPEDCNADVINVLAAMALGHATEVYA